MDNNKLWLVVLLLVAFFALSNRPTGNAVVNDNEYEDMMNYGYNSFEEDYSRPYSQDVAAQGICQLMANRVNVLSGDPDSLMVSLAAVANTCPDSIDSGLMPIAESVAQMIKTSWAQEEVVA